MPRQCRSSSARRRQAGCYCSFFFFKQKTAYEIPGDERSAWCIQEKIEYAPALQAPDGGVKIEIRMMFLRPDDEPKPLLTQNLVRLSRGKMLGVDFNKQFTWVGSSIAVH